jgi:hypothetical protein
MSDKYEVIWSHVAENDLRNIIEYVAEDSPVNASNVFKKIRQKPPASIFYLNGVASSKSYGIMEYYNTVN